MREENTGENDRAVNRKRKSLRGMENPAKGNLSLEAWKRQGRGLMKG